MFNEVSAFYLRQLMLMQVVIMGRDLTKPEDNDLSPLISSGHIISHGQNTPWKDFLRYIESSR